MYKSCCKHDGKHGYTTKQFIRFPLLQFPNHSNKTPLIHSPYGPNKLFAAVHAVVFLKLFELT